MKKNDQIEEKKNSWRGEIGAGCKHFKLPLKIYIFLPFLITNTNVIHTKSNNCLALCKKKNR